MRRLANLIALGLLGGGVALAGGGDQKFVDKAAAGGIAEVKLSTLAMDKGRSTEVKQFARKMVEDHTKANTELKQIADKQNLTLPTTLDDQSQKVYDKLAALDGADFDAAYMRAMANDHDAAVMLFKQESKSGRDPEVKSFAMKTLPVIEKHDDMAHAEREVGSGDAPARAGRRVHDLDVLGRELGAHGVGGGEVLVLARLVALDDESPRRSRRRWRAADSDGRGARRARPRGSAVPRPSSLGGDGEIARQSLERAPAHVLGRLQLAVEDAVGQRQRLVPARRARRRC